MHPRSSSKDFHLTSSKSRRRHWIHYLSVLCARASSEMLIRSTNVSAPSARPASTSISMGIPSASSAPNAVLNSEESLLRASLQTQACKESWIYCIRSLRRRISVRLEKCIVHSSRLGHLSLEMLLLQTMASIWRKRRFSSQKPISQYSISPQWVTIWTPIKL